MSPHKASASRLVVVVVLGVVAVAPELEFLEHDAAPFDLHTAVLAVRPAQARRRVASGVSILAMGATFIAACLQDEDRLAVEVHRQLRHRGTVLLYSLVCRHMHNVVMLE